MRNIAEIIKDDRNGKKLSQTERQIAVAYAQGKYDAVRELEIGNASNTNEVLDKIRAEIEQLRLIGYATVDGKREIARRAVLEVIDKYKAEIKAGSEEK